MILPRQRRRRLRYGWPLSCGGCLGAGAIADADPLALPTPSRAPPARPPSPPNPIPKLIPTAPTHQPTHPSSTCISNKFVRLYALCGYSYSMSSRFCRLRQAGNFSRCASNLQTDLVRVQGGPRARHVWQTLRTSGGIYGASILHQRQKKSALFVNL